VRSSSKMPDKSQPGRPRRLIRAVAAASVAHEKSLLRVECVGRKSEQLSG
jgi:hypothetical protein